MAYVTPHIFDTAVPLTLNSGPELATGVVATIGLDNLTDGAGGIFTWSAASEATDDGVDVIQPSTVSGAGRWLRVSGTPTGGGTFAGPVVFEDTIEVDGAANFDGAADFDSTANFDGIVTHTAAAHFADGTEALPGIAFAGATGTGIYRGGPVLLGFSIAGTNQIRVTSGACIVSPPIGISNANSYLQSTGSGICRFSNVSDNGFDRLQFGGGTASFPAIKINGTSLEAKLADDSAHTTIVTQTVATGLASISSANITGTSAGQLGHAAGVEIVPAPGAGFALEFVSGVVINDFDTAAYTGGGNITFNYGGGGGALSAAVTYANSVGGATDKIALVAAAVPTNNQLVANTGINLVAAAAPTNPGTAAGVLRVRVTYRIHTTGL